MNDTTLSTGMILVIKKGTPNKTLTDNLAKAMLMHTFTLVTFGHAVKTKREIALASYWQGRTEKGTHEDLPSLYKEGEQSWIKHAETTLENANNDLMHWLWPANEYDTKVYEVEDFDQVRKEILEYDKEFNSKTWIWGDVCFIPPVTKSGPHYEAITEIITKHIAKD